MRKFILLLCIFIKTNVFCQHGEIDLHKVIENLNIIYDEEGANSNLYASLLYRLDNPINLNSAEKFDLKSLVFLSDREIELLLQHHKKYGDYLSVHELFFIDGLDSIIVNNIIPFVSIQNHNNRRDTISLFRNLIYTSRRSVTIRYSRMFEKQDGFRNRDDPDEILDDNFYVGMPAKVYGRVEVLESNDFSIGITFEKDPGEAIFYSPSTRQYGFDHYSGFLNLKNRGILKDLIIGTYQVQAGEGLLVGNGFYTGKSANVIGSIKKNFNGIRPYQGASEYGYLRGISAILKAGRFEFDGYYSNKHIDANIEKDNELSGSTGLLVTSLKETGLHRTPQELKEKKNLVENTIGTQILYYSKTKNFRFGFGGILNKWENIIHRLPTYFNQNDFSGDITWGGNTFYNYYKGKMNFFGEAALSKGGGYAIIQGGMFNFSSFLEAALLFRLYDPLYHSIYGRGFSEYTDNSNEQGIYWGLRIRPLPGVEIQAYIDIFRSKWMRYNLASPSVGNEMFLKIESTFRKRGNIIISLKQESKDRNMSNSDDYLYQIVNGVKRNGQLHIYYKLSKNFSVKTRIQGSIFLKADTRTSGFCISQDFSIEKGIFGIHGRLAYFSSQDFFNRQYVYEREALYAYSVPAYNGKGLRLYFLLKIRPNRYMDIWIKPSQYLYLDRETIGTGLSTINGNKKTEIVCQVRIKF